MVFKPPTLWAKFITPWNNMQQVTAPTLQWPLIFIRVPGPFLARDAWRLFLAKHPPWTYQETWCLLLAIDFPDVGRPKVAIYIDFQTCGTILESGCLWKCDSGVFVSGPEWVINSNAVLVITDPKSDCEK